MSIETMTYGAGATMEFNAGYEQAQQRYREELDQLQALLTESRDELVKSREALAKLQANEAFTMSRTMHPLIDALGNLLAPVIQRKIEGDMGEEIESMINERVQDCVREELENSEVFYTAEQVDEKIRDAIEDLDIEDSIENYFHDNLEDEVKAAVRDLDFTVTVR